MYIWNKLGMPSTLLMSLLLVAVAVVGSGCGKSVADLNNAGAEALKAGQFSTAEDLFKQALTKDPTNAVVRSNLVEVYFQQEQWNSALRLIERSLQIEGLPNPLAMKTRQAEILVMMGKNEQARTILEEVTKETPDDDYLLYLSGLTTIYPEEAIRTLKRSKELNPERKETYLALTRALVWDGDTEAALAMLDEYDQKFSDPEQTSLYRTAIYLRDNRMDQVEETLSQLKQASPDHPATRLFEGYQALATEDLELAQALFQSIADRKEVQLRAQLGDALCALMLDNSEETIRLCREVLQQNDSEVMAYNLLGLGHLKRLQRFMAMDYLEKSLQIKPDQPAIRALRDRVAGS